MADQKRQPWMKWYARDWRGDGALRMCSFAARGLWADLISLMHDEGEPYGHLLINGSVPTATQIARILGGTPREIDVLLSELRAAGVCSISEGGAVVCRRMVRDKAKAEADRINGKRGGNPSLFDKEKGGVNPPDKPTDKAQKPDTRYQNPPKPPKGGAVEPEGFEAWYAIFPRKEARRGAAKAYAAALKRATAEQLLDGAKRYAAARAGQDAKFTKLPATWLNNDCWLDQTAQEAPAGTPIADAETARWQARLRNYRPGGPWLDTWGARPETGRNASIPGPILAAWRQQVAA